MMGNISACCLYTSNSVTASSDADETVPSQQPSQQTAIDSLHSTSSTFTTGVNCTTALPKDIRVHSSLPVSAQEALKLASQQYRHALAAIQATSTSSASHPINPSMHLSEAARVTEAASMLHSTNVMQTAHEVKHLQQQQQQPEEENSSLQVPQHVQQWLATLQSTSLPLAAVKAPVHMHAAMPDSAESNYRHADSDLRNEVVQLRAELKAVQARFEHAQVRHTETATCGTNTDFSS